MPAYPNLVIFYAFSSWPCLLAHLFLRPQLMSSNDEAKSGSLLGNVALYCERV